jgi:hypothetical protein
MCHLFINEGFKNLRKDSQLILSLVKPAHAHSGHDYSILQKVLNTKQRDSQRED